MILASSRFLFTISRDSKLTLFLAKLSRAQFPNNLTFTGASRLSRCLIYKVHTVGAAGFQDITLALVCQDFFALPSLFPDALGPLCDSVALAGGYGRISRSSPFVKSFFRFFKSFFSRPDLPDSRPPPGNSRPARRSLILAKPGPFVNPFFLFFRLFSGDFFFRPFETDICL